MDLVILLISILIFSAFFIIIAFVMMHSVTGNKIIIYLFILYRKKQGYENIVLKKDEIHFFVLYEWLTKKFNTQDEKDNLKIILKKDKKTEADIIRAELLMQKLESFARKNNEKMINVGIYTKQDTPKYTIGYNYSLNAVTLREINRDNIIVGGIYFFEACSAKAFIDRNKKELKWYFTEYLYS